MFNAAFLPRRLLLSTTRIRSLTQLTAPITAIELAALFAAGASAACAVALIHLEPRIPGHAILRAMLPLVLGAAIVPRRTSGSIMGAAAGMTVVIFKLAHVGTLQPAAVAGLLLLGPAIDLALSGSPRGRWLYARFALAGLTANLLAFALRFVLSWLHLDARSGGRFRSSPAVSLLSFALCGALAGLLSGMICFRAVARETKAMNETSEAP